jgi:hypothetical protein
MLILDARHAIQDQRQVSPPYPETEALAALSDWRLWPS